MLGTFFLLFFGVGLAGGHCICKEPDQITGKHYSFVGWEPVVVVSKSTDVLLMLSRWKVELGFPLRRNMVETKLGLVEMLRTHTSAGSLRSF